MESIFDTLLSSQGSDALLRLAVQRSLRGNFSIVCFPASIFQIRFAVEEPWWKAPTFVLLDASDAHRRGTVLHVGAAPGPAFFAVVTAVARHAKLPTAFVRKQAKQYGTARLAEGAEVAGRRVLVVEDVVTSGGQVVISTNELRRLGAHVDHALCVIDRQEGGAQALAADGITLRALLTRADLEAAAA